LAAVGIDSNGLVVEPGDAFLGVTLSVEDLIKPIFYLKFKDGVVRNNL